jgi:hypothetical protein
VLESDLEALGLRVPGVDWMNQFRLNQCQI